MLLDKRLMRVASCVKKGAYIIDVGTDHAYVPIYLCKNGIIDKAVASDIREGPLKIAKNNIEKFGLSNQIDTLLCAGLEKAYLYPDIDCAVIAGMGGDMIVSILQNNEELSKRIDLVLQPMTHYVQLRKYLYDNGFSILEEKLAKDEQNRVYQIICAKYTNQIETYKEYELYLGKYLLTHRDVEYFEDNRRYILNKLYIMYRGNHKEELKELIDEIENA